MRSLAIHLTAAVSMLGAPVLATAGILGPSEYLCFDASAIAGCGTAESPFAGVDFSGGYFHLEDFEDGLFNPPGTSSSPTGSVTVPGGSLTDSVDEDDGVIDGLGRNGRSYFGGGAVGFEFTFDALGLGGLPTHAGVVWTDGAIVNEVTFLAWDSTNNLIGTIVAPGIGDSNFLSGTAEDRFFGVTDAGGISRIKIYNSMMSGGGSGIEVDHLQFGRAGARVAEPATVGLLLLGLAGVARLRRRREP